MSDQQDHPKDHADEVHEGPIKTPKQLIWTVVASFLIPIIAIIMLVNFVDFGSREGAGSDSQLADNVKRRIERVGLVEVRDAADPTILRSGEQVFTGQCAACHATGAAGAPKLGDTAAWAPRLPQGYEVLWNSALKGKGAMGPQGGGDYNDVEIGRAVVYLANRAGAKFAEPALPAAMAAASGAADAAATAPVAGDAPPGAPTGAPVGTTTGVATGAASAPR